MRIEPIDDPADPRVADYRDIKDAELRLRRGLFVAESGRGSRLARLCALPHSLNPIDRGGARQPPRGAAGRGRAHLSDEPRGRPRRRRIRLPSRLRRPGRARGRAPLEALMDRPGPASSSRSRTSRIPTTWAASSGTRGPSAPTRSSSPRAAPIPCIGRRSAPPWAPRSSHPSRTLPDWADGLARLRKAGYTLVALTPDPSALDIARLGAGRLVPSRVALLLGAEGPGLRPETRAAADLQMQIAMAPGVDSLNVATAAAIALHRLRSAAAT